MGIPEAAWIFWVDFSEWVLYNKDVANIIFYPGVAQLVARLLWEQDAAGSNPVTRTTGKF